MKQIVGTPASGPPRIHDSVWTSSQGLERPLQRLVEISIKLVGADKGTMQIYDEREKVLKLITSVGFDEESVEAFKSIPFDLSGNGQATGLWHHPIAGPSACATGGIRAVEAVPLRNDQGNVIGLLSTHFGSEAIPSERRLALLELCAQHATQLIETRQSEQNLRAEVARLAQRNADLERSIATLTLSNQELERFASAASHDLLEPLRMITVYAELLAQRCAGEIESGRDTGIFLSYIVQGATRMRELLGDLLTYAEVGTPGEESIDQIDLNFVVQKVLGNLSVSIDESGAVIDIPTLPTLSGHEVDFIQLFQNLLANAIKYRGERPPTIYISTEARDGWIEFAVSDDGIGIAHEHHEAIFQPFKRLRDRSGSGTGMGLAICQRVVERYGGRIWVDSHRDQGATFHFTLPESVVGTQGSREWRSAIDPRVPVR